MTRGSPIPSEHRIKFCINDGTSQIYDSSSPVIVRDQWYRLKAFVDFAGNKESLYVYTLDNQGTESAQPIAVILDVPLPSDAGDNVSSFYTQTQGTNSGGALRQIWIDNFTVLGVPKVHTGIEIVTETDKYQMDDSYIVSADDITVGNLSYGLTLKNHNSLSEDVMVVSAVYGADDELLAVGIDNKTVDGGSTAEFTPVAAIPEGTDLTGCRVKSFVWTSLENEQPMKPLIKPALFPGYFKNE